MKYFFKKLYKEKEIKFLFLLTSIQYFKIHENQSLTTNQSVEKTFYNKYCVSFIKFFTTVKIYRRKIVYTYKFSKKIAKQSIF